MCNLLVLQIRKEVDELTAKLGQQQSAVQDSKENVKQEVVKEEENAGAESSTQMKEEPVSTPTIKKEGEEETEVRKYANLKC